MSKMKTNKYFTSLLLFLTVILFISCVDEDRGNDTVSISKKGGVEINFEVSQSDYILTTRNNAELKEFYALAFDDKGIFISIQEAVLKSANNYSIRLEPSHTKRVVHLLASYSSIVSQALGSDMNERFQGKEEREILPRLNTNSLATPLFWSRVELPSIASATTTIAPVSLLRNQAKLSIKSSVAEQSFTLQAFGVHNAADRGTFVSFDSDTQLFDLSAVTEPASAQYIGLEGDDSLVPAESVVSLFERRTPFLSTSGLGEFYIIIKGLYSDKVTPARTTYYKLALSDSEKQKLLPVLRNHHYAISITKVNALGYDTMKEAMDNVAANNSLLAVDVEDYDKITDGVNWLEVSDIAYFFTQGGEDFSLTYHYYNQKDALSAEELVDRAVLEDPTGVFTDFDVEQVRSLGNGLYQGVVNGKIATSLPDYGDIKTAIIKVQFGHLVRYVKVRLAHKTKLNTTLIEYGNKQGFEVDIHFTIPEGVVVDKSLYPLDIIIPTSSLYPNIEKGSNSHLVLEGNTVDGYHYLYKAYQSGEHTIRMRRNRSNVKEQFTLESLFFEFNEVEVNSIAVEQFSIDCLLPNQHSITSVEYDECTLNPGLEPAEGGGFTLELAKSAAHDKRFSYCFSFEGLKYTALVTAEEIRKNNSQVTLLPGFTENRVAILFNNGTTITSYEMAEPLSSHPLVRIKEIDTEMDLIVDKSLADDLTIEFTVNIYNDYQQEWKELIGRSTVANLRKNSDVIFDFKY